MNSVTLWADSNCGIAENPLWHETEEKLYWKGSGGKIFRKAADGTPSGSFEEFHLSIGEIGGFVFMENGGLLIFAQHGRVWSWHAGKEPLLEAELPGADDKTYFNDLIADPEGRVYCGVMAHDYFQAETRGRHGSLWRLDQDNRFHCLEEKIGICPNGMGFSRDFKHFYFVISDEAALYRYDYECETGVIRNQVPLICRSGCDGMTVDSEGGLWVALWGNGYGRFSLDGKKLLEFPMPPRVRAVSSVTFGGPGFKTLFLSTANYPPDDADSVRFLGGGIFSQEQSVGGVPEFKVRNR